MKNRNLLYIVPLLLIAACQPSIDEFTPSKGSADFSSYIAAGDSWTAGMADAALYKSGQENSFPNILAGKFQTAGGGDFKQPLMVDDFGFGVATGVPTPKLVMDFRKDCKDVLGLLPGYADVQVNPANFQSVAGDGPYNNIGLPGQKTFYMAVAGLATLHPYYERFASAVTNRVIDEIAPINPTFFTLWLGSYDALAYAIGGGNDPENPLTAAPVFTGSFQVTLEALTANGAKGAVANIPDLLDAPFFHTIPYNALPIPDQATADFINAFYAVLNQVIIAAGSTDTIHFNVGPNPLVIQDLSLPWGRRQIKPTELVLLSLPQDSLKCAGWGSQKPVPVQYILDETEIASVNQAINDYNNVISGLVTGNNMILVDMKGVLDKLSEGYVFDGINFNNSFVTGNFYSTDGLNPSFRGNAMIAYYFIEAINEGFGANLPQVVVSDYPGVPLPQ
jgi:hypothetical protein